MAPNKYAEFRKLWKQAHPSLAKSVAEEQVIQFWREHKQDSEIINLKIKELTLKYKSLKNPLLSAFQKQIRKTINVSSNSTSHNLPALSQSVQIVTVPEKERSSPCSRLSESIQKSGSGYDSSGLISSRDRDTGPKSTATFHKIGSNEKDVFQGHDLSAPGRSAQIVTLPNDSEVEVVSQSDQQNSSTLVDKTTTLKSKKPRHAQEKLQIELADINKEQLSLIAIKNFNMHFTREMQLNLNTLNKKAKDIETSIRRLKSNRIAAMCLRLKRKKEVEDWQKENPNAVNKYKSLIPNIKKGRPNIERQQNGLTKAILDIVSRNCGADDKRRCETLLCNLQLKDLLAELKSMDFKISRQGLSLRFKPRNKASLWGRRHVSTVNVKLSKASNTLRKDHQDAHFAAASVKYLNDLAEVFGADCVNAVSVDDKARVPLGLPAATKQAPILMRMDYEVRLPDHDWVVGSKHKMIVSVTAGLVFESGHLTYSGPTMISVRSGKHDSSTAETHANDMDRFFTLKKFDYFTKHEGKVKPILIMFVDGGPDENPRYPKTLIQAIRHFKNYDLDGIFIATHAPHHSAHNPVERRMAPLSRDLCGVILPYKHFGSHLNSSGITIDKEKEVQNFDKAGHVLAEIWNNKTIDGHTVFSEYVHPPSQQECHCTKELASNEVITSKNHPRADHEGADVDDVFSENDSDDDTGCEEPADESNTVEPRGEPRTLEFEITEEWKAAHVRQSQYMLQIIKCNNLQCCSAPKTQLKKFFPTGFLPAPVLYTTAESGPIIADRNTPNAHYKNLCYRIAQDFQFIKHAPSPLPYDWYCPSVGDSVLEKSCNWCGIYFPTKVALTQHKKVHIQAGSVRRNNVEEDALVDFVVNDVEPEEVDEIILIDNMDQWLSPCFVPVE